MPTKQPNSDAPDWPRIRADYEAGETFRSLAKRHPVSREGIRKRALRENWQQDLEPFIQRATNAAVANAGATVDTQKRAEAIQAEAERRAAVVARHREEWAQVAALRQEALRLREPTEQQMASLTLGDEVQEANLRGACAAAAFNKAKLAKITAEMTAIQQSGERRAWKLDNDTAPSDGLTIRVIREPPKNKGADDDGDEQNAD